MSAKQYSIGILVVLLIPIAVSQTSSQSIWTDGQEGRELRWSILHQNTGNGGTSSFSGNGSWEKFHSLDKASPNSTMYVEVWLAITIQGMDDGEWTYSFEASIGEDWSGCQSNFVTRNPGTLGGSPVIYHSFPILCGSIVPNATEDQEFTWWVNRTATTGDPDVPEAQHLSIQLDRSDLVVYPMDINLTNLEYWLPVLLGLALTVTAFLLIFRAHWAWIFPMLLGAIGTVTAAFPDDFLGDPNEVVIVFVIGALYLMLIVGAFGAARSTPKERRS